MISLVDEYSAVLDACILVPISLCDLMLRLAEDPALYQPKWSLEILVELRRTLQGPKFQLEPEKAEYRIACMQSAFPEAMISGYELLCESMPNDPRDRHVLAAAVYGKADAIVTLNSRHFPPECLRQFGIERLTPDQFLTHQWRLDPEVVKTKIRAQSADCSKSMSAHLSLLARMVPKFTGLVRSSLDDRPHGIFIHEDE
jgi:predicted nucleic acid-binding protein